MSQFKVSDIPDLSGKIALVTGGTSGIGLETAYLLASKGAKVYFTARSPEKGQGTEELIRKRLEGNERAGSVQVHELDLATIQGAADSAVAFLAKESRLDILIANAGMGMERGRLSPDGFEMTFQVNHLSHYAFIDKLLPVIERTAEEFGDARIIGVTSGAAFEASTIDFENLRDAGSPGAMTAWRQYARSKLAVLLGMKELARREWEKGALKGKLWVNSVHPGMIVRTGLGGDGSSLGIPKFLETIVRGVLNVFSLNCQEGAMTQVYLATSKDVPEKEIHGRMYAPALGWTFRYAGVKEITPQSGPGNDAQLAGRLWEYSDEQVREVMRKGRSEATSPSE